MPIRCWLDSMIIAHHSALGWPQSSINQASIKRDLFNVIMYYGKSGRSQNRRAFVFIKHFFFKWPIIWLDKTLIHRLVSFIALRSCTETVILTFNSFESIETNYMDTNRRMFSSKTLIYFQLKKEIHKHLGWHGGEVNYKDILIWKWTSAL